MDALRAHPEQMVVLQREGELRSQGVADHAHARRRRGYRGQRGRQRDRCDTGDRPVEPQHRDIELADRRLEQRRACHAERTTGIDAVERDLGFAGAQLADHRLPAHHMVVGQQHLMIPCRVERRAGYDESGAERAAPALDPGDRGGAPEAGDQPAVHDIALGAEHPLEALLDMAGIRALAHLAGVRNESAVLAMQQRAAHDVDQELLLGASGVELDELRELPVRAAERERIDARMRDELHQRLAGRGMIAERDVRLGGVRVVPGLELVLEVARRDHAEDVACDLCRRRQRLESGHAIALGAHRQADEVDTVPAVLLRIAAIDLEVEPDRIAQRGLGLVELRVAVEVDLLVGAAEQADHFAADRGGEIAIAHPLEHGDRRGDVTVIDQPLRQVARDPGLVRMHAQEPVGDQRDVIEEPPIAQRLQVAARPVSGIGLFPRRELADQLLAQCRDARAIQCIDRRLQLDLERRRIPTHHTTTVSRASAAFQMAGRSTLRRGRHS